MLLIWNIRIVTAFKISFGICEDAIRRVGFMNSQKVEPAPKIFAISSSFGRKVFGNYPLYDSAQLPKNVYDRPMNNIDPSRLIL